MWRRASVLPRALVEPLRVAGGPTRRRFATAARRSAATRDTRGLPLHGVRVVDLSRVLAGPYATMMMADQGADVVKIERPGLGDETRQWGPPFADFLSVNRNKRSVAVDLSRPEGLDLVRRLVADADVLVENFLPGKLDGLGLGWDECRRLNPRLVYASITGYGSTGPYADRGGYDVVASAVGGLMHITGPAGGEPCKVGVAMTDLSTGLYLHASVLAALLSRERTGLGSRVECSLLETQVASLVNVASAYLNAGVDGDRLGTAHASIVPYQAFPTSDGHIVVAAMNDGQFARLCAVVDMPDVGADARFATNPERVRNRSAVLGVLTKRFREKTSAEWAEAFDGSGLAFGPINSIAQVFDDPQVQHRKMVVEMDHSTAGKVRVPATPVKWSAQEGQRSPNDVSPTPPPRLGEHTLDVMRELGVGESEALALAARGVVGVM